VHLQPAPFPFDRIHAADCGRCETTDGLLDHIDCDVELTAVLSEEQHVRLLEIAASDENHRASVDSASEAARAAQDRTGSSFAFMYTTKCVSAVKSDI
jgi:hypothetical protein